MKVTMVDHWFIDKTSHTCGNGTGPFKRSRSRYSCCAKRKRIEFPDNVISRLTGLPEAEIKQMRYDNGIVASYKMVDTCAAGICSQHTLLLFRLRRGK